MSQFQGSQTGKFPLTRGESVSVLFGPSADGMALGGQSAVLQCVGLNVNISLMETPKIMLDQISGYPMA